MLRPALGLVETAGIDGAIEATRAASRAGQVVIVSAEKSVEGRMTVKIEGDWSAVQAAVEAGARAAYQAGQLVSMHVIPRSDNGVSSILPYPRFVDRYRPEGDAPPRKKPRPTGQQARSKPIAPPFPTQSVTESTSEPTAATDMPAAERVPPQPEKQRPAPPALVSQADAPEARPSWEELQRMAVVKLRRYARSLAELSIKGRQISKANKQQLLEALRSVRKDGR